MKKFEVTFDVIGDEDIGRFVVPSFWFYIWAKDEGDAKMKVWAMGLTTCEGYSVSCPALEEVTE